MEAVEPNWMSLIVFAAAWGVGCVGVFYLVGLMPLSAAPGEVQRGIGPTLVLANVAFVALLVVSTLVFAIAELRWTSLVVAGGMVFLFSPFVVQDLPEVLKNNKLGLVIVLALTVAGIALLHVAGLTQIIRDFMS